MGMVKRIAVLAAAVAAVAGAPATAAASQGGIDPTRHCIQDAANTYLYNPYSVGLATEYAERTVDCARYLVGHMASPARARAWVDCVRYGLGRSLPPLNWDPLLYAVQWCTEDWLEFTVRVDPYPS